MNKTYNQSLGRLVGLTGIYTGAKIEITEEELIIGRDSNKVNLVISGDHAKHVSRTHCGIRYDSKIKQYLVTDYSSDVTCTQIRGGNKLPKNIPTVLPEGTIIELGNAENSFRLEKAQEKAVEKPAYEKNARGGMAVASLVLGVLSLVLAVFGFGFRWGAVVLGVMGVIFGALGRKCVTRKGMATAGLVMSIIGSLISILIYIAYASLISSVSRLFDFF